MHFDEKWVGWLLTFFFLVSFFALPLVSLLLLPGVWISEECAPREIQNPAYWPSYDDHYQMKTMMDSVTFGTMACAKIIWLFILLVGVFDFHSSTNNDKAGFINPQNILHYTYGGLMVVFVVGFFTLLLSALSQRFGTSAVIMAVQILVAAALLCGFIAWRLILRGRERMRVLRSTPQSI